MLRRTPTACNRRELEAQLVAFLGDKKVMKQHVFVKRTPSWSVRLEQSQANDFWHPPLDLDEFTPKTSPYGPVLYNLDPASWTCRLPQRVCKRSGLSKIRLLSEALAAHAVFWRQVASFEFCDQTTCVVGPPVQ